MTTDDLQVQLEQLEKIEAEEKARELLKQETSYDSSYQEIIKKGGTGFMEAYVEVTADFKTMTTTAKRDVVLSLAKSDLLRDLALFLLEIKGVSFRFQLNLQILNSIVCFNLSCFIPIYNAC